MIDIHSHILPGIDDGASTAEESVQMLEMYIEDGIDTIVATPHVYHEISRIENLAQITAKVTELQDLAKKNNLNITILQGAEIFFDSDLKKKLYAQKEFLTLNNSDYFLLEFPLNFIFPGVKDFLFDILVEGLVPIICHPERNQILQANPQILFEYVQMGALSQLNAGSFRGDFGSDVHAAALNFLKSNLVHVIATDTHNYLSRPPQLSFIYKYLSEFPKEQIDKYVYDIPKAIISNQAIPDIGMANDPRKKSFFMGMMKRLFNK
jgi:protein-tyrosine phosphatase